MHWTVPRRGGFFVAVCLGLVVLHGCSESGGSGPTLAPIADQRTTVGDVIDVALTIDDPSGAATVEAESSDDDLVPEGGLQVLDDPSGRTLRITPAPGATGTVTITVRARNADGSESVESFALAIEMPFRTVGALLTAADPGDDDQFGVSVAMDGGLVVVGASGDDAAYLFQLDGESWTQLAKLTPSDLQGEASFGSQVAIDGDTVVVGAVSDDLSGTNRGSAYVFRSVDGAWTQTQKLMASDGEDNDVFGIDIALSGDVAVVGASQHGATNLGAAYVFERSGDAWTEVAKLEPTVATDYLFGRGVYMDGDVLLAGSVDAAYLFQREGSGWVQEARIPSPAEGENINFGTDLATHAEGDTIFVGANVATVGSGDRQGAVYVYKRDGSDGWTLDATLTGGTLEDRAAFGGSISVDGDYLISGAFNEDVGGDDYGAAYVFLWNGQDWQQVAKLTATDPADNDRFGFAVAMDDGVAIVGAFRDDLSGVDEGSVHVFRR